MEHFFTCPYCWENISMLLESYTSETYIEDCEVCCNPIQITTKWENDTLVYFEAQPIEQ